MTTQLQRPNYDYLLAVGPGRSGTDFFYQNLRLNPHFTLPEIKEAAYYKSLKRFLGGRCGLFKGEASILADISNLAYKDPLLGPGVSLLKGLGVRVLLIVLLREHCDRARSMYRYRRSRGHLSAWLGTRQLERSVVQDRLTLEQLDQIYQIGVDVLSIDFSALVRNPDAVFGHLSGLCGVTAPERVEHRITNRSVRSRNLALSTLAMLGAALLRTLGLRRLLQRLKDLQWLERLLFVPLPEEERAVTLGSDSVRILDKTFADCLSAVQVRSQALVDGAYLRKASC